MSKKKYHTDFLFANGDFIIGAGSVLNIAGNYYEFNYSETPKEADKKAIHCDWGVIGQDIMETCETLDKELKK